MGRVSDNAMPVEIYETISNDQAEGSARHERSISRLDTAQPLFSVSTQDHVVYKVYKRRFFGLVQLVLLNIVVSWDWILFAPVSSTAATYFNTTESVINWLSTAFMFSFLVATPFTFYALAKHGPQTSIVISSLLVLLGNWVKYGGAKSKAFGAVMVGQLCTGLAQPFVLAAPTTYSNLWFSAQGRTSATAVASLANPLGAALGQLVAPFWVSQPSDIPQAVLYTAIIASVACLPSFFIPTKPPTPPSAASSVPDTHHSSQSLKSDIQTLFTSREFYLLFIPFAVLVGFFNAFSSLLNQFLEPYAVFTEDDAGIAGALLIFVGLAAAAVSSPLIDRYKCYLPYVKTTVPIIGVMYLAVVWAPASQSRAFVYVVCAVLGASSFSLVPVVLEFLVEIQYPVGVEVGSTVCWAGGQLLGGIFIIIMDKLKGSGGGAESGSPRGEMTRALVFEAVLALAVVPLPLCLGLFGRQEYVRRRRWEKENGRTGIRDEVEERFVTEGETSSQVASPISS